MGSMPCVLKVGNAELGKLRLCLFFFQKRGWRKSFEDSTDDRGVLKKWRRQGLVAQPLPSLEPKVLLFLNNDILRDRENPWYAVSPDVGNVLVHLVGGNSFQSHLP